MSSLGAVLFTTLSLAPPDPALDAPIVVTPPPPPSPSVVVVASTPAPSPTLPPASPPVPPEPNSGDALFGAAAVIFAVGLGAQIVNAASQANYCQRWDERGFNSVHGCFYASEPWVGHARTGFAFGSALLMSSIGAAALGHDHAWRSAYGDRRARNPRAHVGAGIALLTLGLGAFAAEAIVLGNELDNYCTTHACEVQRRTLYYGLADAGSVGLIAGMSLIAYGRSYTNHRRRYDWSLIPRASPRMFGASARLQF